MNSSSPSSKNRSGEEMLTTLDRVSCRCTAVVSRLLPGNSELSTRLAALGVVAGSCVEVLRQAPFGDPITIRLSSCTLSLRLAEAKQILVALTPELS
jgi:Fe2+ transport system protein FeoA